ncbi:hypothetical protein KFL_002430090 [Klebsormidium nitens]|uniref:Uncharacterized protein n=1 Tax=Klebsormidium nitens TaxID=105231 RepID=A0A1Y1I522_KLENI|nr:hypothetical protein KFL_002430090 [Klebsormidium nitens]|eukprot:GAQ85593.1 hypothetical protein KFL_002430090 [Klebsormidium nitens]
MAVRRVPRQCPVIFPSSLYNQNGVESSLTRPWFALEDMFESFAKGRLILALVKEMRAPEGTGLPVLVWAGVVIDEPWQVSVAFRQATTAERSLCTMPAVGEPCVDVDDNNTTGSAHRTLGPIVQLEQVRVLVRSNELIIDEADIVRGKDCGPAVSANVSLGNGPSIELPVQSPC